MGANCRQHRHKDSARKLRVRFHRQIARAGPRSHGKDRSIGIPHTFKNNGQSAARMLVFVMPSGFENFVKEFAQPLPSFDSPAIPVTQEEIDKLIAVTPKYGIEILSPPAA